MQNDANNATAKKIFSDKIRPLVPELCVQTLIYHRIKENHGEITMRN